MKHIKHTAFALGTAVFVASGTAAAFSIPWWTIDAGGTASATSGDWELAGTIGQHDASEAKALTGDNWQLTGGFWIEPGDLSQDDLLFRDRFEE